MGTKETNPKQAVGVRKVPLHVVPCEVLMEIGLGMMEGARKYGAHNYRACGVRASVYYDAAMQPATGDLVSDPDYIVGKVLPRILNWPRTH